MNLFSENWHVSPYLAEVRVQYRSKVADHSRPQLCSPEDAYRYLREIWNMDVIEIQEEFYVLLLNNSRKCLGWTKISMGGKTSTIVDPPQIIAIALLTNASSIIISHNHPSGKLKPSTADINLTKRIGQALKIMGLRLDDHIIITRDDYYSLNNEGQLRSLF